MTANPGELQLLRMRFDPLQLAELGKRHQLPLQQADTGYLVHAQLKELFGDDAPRPFALQEGRDQRLNVLAYTTAPVERLRERAELGPYGTLRPENERGQLEATPMFTGWKAGQQLGFAVRACPIVRKKRGGQPDSEAVEVDAFLARCWAVGDRNVPVDREEVYRAWLQSELERRGGAKLVHAELRAFKRTKLLRRTHEENRRAHPTERPDALLEGMLEVTDPPAFNALLARGVGRHRAFGFGMLLLRRP